MKEDTKHRGMKHSLNTEAETGVMHLQAKEGQALLAATRSWGEAGKDPPSEPTERAWPFQHLDF